MGEHRRRDKGCNGVAAYSTLPCPLLLILFFLSPLFLLGFYFLFFPSFSSSFPLFPLFPLLHASFRSVG